MGEGMRTWLSEEEELFFGVRERDLLLRVFQ